jgi:hypothetical protein
MKNEILISLKNLLENDFNPEYENLSERELVKILINTANFYADSYYELLS